MEPQWIQCQSGQVRVYRLADGRYSVWATNQGTETVQAHELGIYVEEMVRTLGGRTLGGRRRARSYSSGDAFERASNQGYARRGYARGGRAFGEGLKRPASSVTARGIVERLLGD